MTIREQLCRLIDELPEHELTTAQRYLEFLRERGEGRVEDPLLRVLREAPIDDEPVTDEDLAVIAEARGVRAR